MSYKISVSPFRSFCCRFSSKITNTKFHVSITHVDSKQTINFFFNESTEYDSFSFSSDYLIGDITIKITDKKISFNRQGEHYVINKFTYKNYVGDEQSDGKAKSREKYGVLTYYFPSEINEGMMFAYCNHMVSHNLCGQNIFIKSYTKIDEEKYLELEALRTKIIKLIEENVLGLKSRDQTTYSHLFKKMLPQLTQIFFVPLNMVTHKMFDKIKTISYEDEDYFVIRFVNSKRYYNLTPIKPLRGYWDNGMLNETQDEVFHKQKKVLSVMKLLKSR